MRKYGQYYDIHIQIMTSKEQWEIEKVINLMSTSKGHVLGITKTNGANLSSLQEEGREKGLVPYNNQYKMIMVGQQWNDNASNNYAIPMEWFAYLMIVKGA